MTDNSMRAGAIRTEAVQRHFHMGEATDSRRGWNLPRGRRRRISWRFWAVRAPASRLC